LAPGFLYTNKKRVWVLLYPKKGEKFIAVFSLEERLRVWVDGDHSPIDGVRDCGGVHGYTLGGG
jgi:hypothetical protein